MENVYIFFFYFLHFNIDVPMFTPIARALIFKLVLYLCNSNEHWINGNRNAKLTSIGYLLLLSHYTGSIAYIISLNFQLPPTTFIACYRWEKLSSDQISYLPMVTSWHHTASDVRFLLFQSCNIVSSQKKKKIWNFNKSHVNWVEMIFCVGLNFWKVIEHGMW